MAAETLVQRFESRKFTILLVAIVVVQIIPLVRGGTDDSRDSLLWTLILLSAVHASTGNRKVTMAVGALALVGFGGRVYTLFVPGISAEVATLAGVATFLAVIIFLILRAVLTASRINGDTVAGAVCVYLMIGIMWTMFYGIVELVEPGSFRYPDHVVQGDILLPEYVFGYFSFVTLTTLGYGEITPITYRAKTLAWMEAVVGVTYMATLIAFLASQVTLDRQRRDHEEA